MTDAHRDLIDETRRRHTESYLRRGNCAWCLSRWPCTSIRLAEALEQAERNTEIAVAMADDKNVYWQIAQTAEAVERAERRAAELELANVRLQGIVDGARRMLLSLGICDEESDDERA